MINLNNSSGSGLPSNEPAPAAGQPGSSAAPQVNQPIPPGRTPAPAVIDGFTTPPGSTIVDDPKLRDEILKNLRR